MGNECRCIMCKKQLIGGETVICPRCFYMGHKVEQYVKRHPVVTAAAVAVIAAQTRKLTVASKAIVQLTKFI